MENFEKQNLKVDYYDVYTTNGVDGYITGETLKKVCSKMNSEQISQLATIVNLNEFAEEKQYIATDELIKFIKANTYNPQYKPRFVLVKWRERILHSGDNEPDEKENEIYIGGVSYEELEETHEKGMSL